MRQNPQKSAKRVCLPLVMLVLSLAPSVAADAETFQVIEIAPELVMLSRDQGSYCNNALVFWGPDGVLLVDTHAARDAEALRTYVDELGFGAPKYIINTHRHVEHIGGNAAWGEAPIGVAHSLFPGKLREGSFLFTEYQAAFFPEITFADSLTLRFNDETIRLVAIGGSHDDNEIMVHFVERGIAHVSSVVNGFNFPSVDGDGDALRFAELTERLMALLPRDVRIVSGHHGKEKGFEELGRWEQLPAYAAMMRQTEAIVRRELSSGRSLEQMREGNVLEAYVEYAGSYVDADGWLEYLVDAIEEPKERGADICRVVYEAWKELGAMAAVERYRSLSATQAESWDDNEYLLMSIGSKLQTRGLHADALVFLQGSLDTYPDAEYTYYTHYLAAQCCEALGRDKEAIIHAREALELKPEFEGAANLVEELAQGAPEG